MKNNPARRLYERLGFVVTGETEVQYWMRSTAHAGAGEDHSGA
jgi:ribosomal protein S18 acetylase RimI-like enzyme